MAGYYDPNKDYSKELQRTDLTASERAQLTQERQNKINDRYGGVEPVMTGSNKTYSQTYSSGSSSGGGSSSSGASKNSGTSYNGTTTDLTKGPGYVTGGYTAGVNGTPILSDNPNYKGVTRADMSRRPDLAGQVAVSNGYTIYYDEDGYARKATKGAVDYLPSQDLYVKNGTYKGGSLWTDEESVSAADLAAIQGIRDRLSRGELTAEQANQLANQIRGNYGYTIDTAGNVYDFGTDAAVTARRQRLGLETKALTDAQQRYLQMMFPEQQTTDVNALLSAMDALTQGTYNSNVQYTGTAGNGAPAAGAAGAVGGGYSGYGSGGYGDMTDYINDMYAQQLEAELAALKTAYDNNVAEVESQNDRIAEQYRAARNQAAAQNALETQRMNELGIAQGLNTGATGQMAFSQNAAYQGNLGNLWAQEAQDQADVDLMLAQLMDQYNGNVYQATAQSNAQRTQALLEEMVRQQELAAQQQALSREYAMNLLSSGVMPDSATLSSAGISANEANALSQIYKQQIDANLAKTLASTAKTSSGSSKSSTASATKPRLTWAQVKKELEDGNTNAAVLSAYQYYMGEPYGGASNGSSGSTGTGGSATGNTGYNASNFNAAMSSIRTALDQGNTNTLYSGISSMWGKLSNTQKETVQRILAEYGLSY